MEITLSELLTADFFKQSEILAGEKGLSNKVTFVTILDSPDAPKYLKGGELVVTTAYSLLNDPAQQALIIENLALKKAAALGIKLRFFHNQLPQIMKDKADEHDFPIFTIPNEYAYTDILDFVINNIICRQTKEFKRKEEASDDFLRSIDSDGFHGVVKALHKWTGLQSAVLYEQVKYEYPGAFLPENILEQSSKWRARLFNDLPLYNIKDSIWHYSLEADQEEARQWIGVELKFKGNLKGYVLLWQGERPFDQNDSLLLDFAATACKMEIQRIVSIRTEQQKFKNQCLTQLLQNQFSTFEEAANRVRDIGWRLPEEASVFAIVSSNFSVEFYENDVLPVLHNLFNTKYNGRIINGIFADNGIVVIVAKDLAQSRLAEDIYKELQKKFAQVKFYLGIGRTAAYQDLLNSFKEAKHAIRIGSSSYADSGVFYFANLGFYRLLHLPHVNSEIVKFYEDYLKSLLDFDADNHTDLVRTLSLFLENGCNYRETAKKLYLHPNSIRYRMQLVEKIGKLNLKSAEDRINISLALRIGALANEIKKELSSK